MNHEKICVYERDHGIVDECDFCGWHVEVDDAEDVKVIKSDVVEKINMLNAWMVENCCGNARNELGRKEK